MQWIDAAHFETEMVWDLKTLTDRKDCIASNLSDTGVKSFLTRYLRGKSLCKDDSECFEMISIWFVPSQMKVKVDANHQMVCSIRMGRKLGIFGQMREKKAFRKFGQEDSSLAAFKLTYNILKM